MTVSTLELLQQVARGEGFDPSLESELDRLEDAGLLEVHYKHRDPDTGAFQHIVALLTPDGWDAVHHADSADASTHPGTGRQAG